MSDSSILRLLQRAIGGATSLPVKYVNTNFKTPNKGNWWEIVYLPNDIENEFWGKEKTFRGVLRLILHCEQKNEGIYKPLGEVENMMEVFFKGCVFYDVEKNVKVQIVENPRMNDIIEEPPSLLIPLTIRYQCFKV